MAKKHKDSAPETFIDEKQVDEISAPVFVGDEPKDVNSGRESKRWIVGSNAISGTRKGIVAPGEKVTADYFRHGWLTLNTLIDDGAVVEEK